MIQATKFKETELGLIPEEWDVKELDKEIIDINKKSITKTDSFTEINYYDTSSVCKGVFATPTKFNFNDAPSRAKRLAEINDILISTVRPNQEHYGFISKLTSNDVFSTGFVIIHCKKINSKYLYYQITSPLMTQKLHQIAESHTSTYPSFKPSDIQKIKIAVPPLLEQKAIAKILSDLDSKIELLQQQNRTLEKVGKVLFKQWFVNFEFPNEDGKPYKSSGGKMIDSELGEIPEGWSVDLLGNYVESVSGCSYTSKGLQDSDEALVTLKSIGVDGFKQEGFKEYTGDYKDKHVVEDGDIVVAHTDLTQNRIVLGKPAIVRDLGKYKKMIASMDLSIVRPIKLLNRPFIFYLLSTNGFHGHAQGYSNGTTVVHLSRKAIPEFSFVVPAQNVLDQFKSILINVFDRFRINEQNMLFLSKTRDLLLPKLMTGKIRVPLEDRE